MDQFETQDLGNQDSENSTHQEQPSAVQFNTVPSATPSFSLNLSLYDLKSLTGWATFKAILEIIVGALSCLGIITAAFGVPQIISGVKLLNAVDELKRYIAVNDIQRISNSLRNMQQYFKMRGITSIIMIVFYIVFIILYAILVAYLISQGGDFMRDFSNMPSF